MLHQPYRAYDKTNDLRFACIIRQAEADSDLEKVVISPKNVLSEQLNCI